MDFVKKIDWTINQILNVWLYSTRYKIVLFKRQFFIQRCLSDRKDNESVLAIQPAQPTDQSESTLKDNVKPNITQGSFWWQISLLVRASIAAVTLIAAAPFCHYKKWPRGLNGHTGNRESSADASQSIFQRLIGNFLSFLIIAFSFLFVLFSLFGFFIFHLIS